MASDKNLRVYVGNLAWSVKDEALQEHMSQAGTVSKVTIFKNESGLSRGCAIVTYELPDEAAAAIKSLNDSELQDRKIFVREDREEVDGPPIYSQNDRRNRYDRGRRSFRGRSRFRFDDGRRGGGNDTGGSYAIRPARGRYEVSVNNLSLDTTWRDLKDLFREVGIVTRADVVPLENGERNGVVIFTRQEDAAEAVARMNNRELQGSKLTVTM